MRGINIKLSELVELLCNALDKLDTLAEQNAQIIELLTDIKNK